MSRVAILNAIKKNKPESVPLPEMNLDGFKEDMDLIETFSLNVQSVGGRVISLNTLADLDDTIKKIYPHTKNIVSCTLDSQLGTVTLAQDMDPHYLEPVDLAIINAELGVAENGAIWISEKDFKVRVLPFIATNLVLILSKKTICLHMHDAYGALSIRDRNFGLFISGPSKTADIEQCLVIGAQGAISVTVVLF